MEIGATSSASAATTTSKTTEDEKKDSSALTADFNTFLTLLTTQMRNQDPLKPMESTEFVAQLASFSSVEQQIRSNDRLDNILSALGGNGAGLAEWIGREVRAPASAAFTGDPVEVALTPITGADKAEMVVRNDFDQVVARVNVATDATSATWDGTDGLGTTLADGSYSFTLEGFDGDTKLEGTKGAVYAKVNEVRVVDGESVLVLADGDQVSLDDVSGIR